MDVTSVLSPITRQSLEISPRVKFMNFQRFHFHFANFTKGEIHEFSAFPFSLHLIFDQTLSNLIVCLMISQNLQYKLYKRASMLQWILGKFGFSQNNYLK